MTPAQIQEFVEKVENELERTRDERNFFQTERDKINHQWEVTKRELEAKKAELRIKEKEIEENKLKGDITTKEYHQKIRYLEYDYHWGLSKQKAQSFAFHRDTEADHHEEENALSIKVRDKTLELQKQELSYEDMVKRLKLEEIEAVKKSKEEINNVLQETLKENKLLSHLKKESLILSKRMDNYDRNICSLSITRNRLTIMTEKVKELEFENEVLGQNLKKVETQREALYNQFVMVLRSIQQKTGLKNLFLEKKIEAFLKQLLGKDVTFSKLPPDLDDSLPPPSFEKSEKKHDESFSSLAKNKQQHPAGSLGFSGSSNETTPELFQKDEQEIQQVQETQVESESSPNVSNIVFDDSEVHFSPPQH